MLQDTSRIQILDAQNPDSCSESKTKTGIVITYLCKQVYPQYASLARGNNPSTKGAF